MASERALEKARAWILHHYPIELRNKHLNSLVRTLANKLDEARAEALEEAAQLVDAITDDPYIVERVRILARRKAEEGK
jgi:hypothetical protein